jgi:hypothetical protein
VTSRSHVPNRRRSRSGTPTRTGRTPPTAANTSRGPPSARGPAGWQAHGHRADRTIVGRSSHEATGPQLQPLVVPQLGQA